MSVPELFSRHPTRAAIDSLAARLNVPNDSVSQDWPYDVADPDRVDEFLAAYELAGLPDDERFVLMEIIIQSFEDSSIDLGTDCRWKQVLAALDRHIATHAHTVWYWAMDREALDLCWRVTPFIRAVRDANWPTVTGKARAPRMQARLRGGGTSSPEGVRALTTATQPLRCGRTDRPARVCQHRVVTLDGRAQRLHDPMIAPRLNLVNANLELLTAAVTGVGALEAVLGVSVADDWAGFPEALPILRAAYAKNPNGHRWGSLFFVDSHVRTLVGFGGFKGPPSADGVVEIGYAIAPAFQRRGLATDAVAQMVQRAFDDTIVRAVDAHTLGHVNPSTRILDRSGFRKIGEANDPDVGVIWHWRRERPAL